MSETKLMEFLDQFSVVSAARAPSTQARACAQLGIDHLRYEELSASSGGTALTAWTLVPEEAAFYRPVAARWLGLVDRAIVDGWSRASTTDGLKAGKHEAEELLSHAIGFGCTEQSGDTIGLRLSDDRSGWIHISLPHPGRWEIVAGLRGRMQQGQTIRLTLDARAIGPNGKSSSAVSLVVEFPAIGTLAWLEGSSLEYLSIMPVVERSQPSGPVVHPCEIGEVCHVKMWSEGKSALLVAVSSMGLDPRQTEDMIAQLDPKQAGRLVSAFEQPGRREFSTSKALITYAAYLGIVGLLGAGSERVAEDLIDLSGPFRGFGWSPVKRIATDRARCVAAGLAGLLVAEIAQPGSYQITIRGIDPQRQLHNHQVGVAVNGVVLDTEYSPQAGEKWLLRAAMVADCAGRVLITIVPKQGAEIWFQSIAVEAIDTAENAATIMVDRFWRSVSPHLVHPDLREAALLPSPIEIPNAERTLLVFGRDPLAYRDYAARLGGAVEDVLAAAPYDDGPSKRAQAWLDLLDETIVRMLVDAPCEPAHPLMLGWGNLIDTASGSARILGGAGEGIILVPPSAVAQTIDLRFAKGSNVHDLNRLTVTINGRPADRSTLYFREELPRLRLDVGGDALSFGKGWLAIRLAMPNVAEPKTSTLFGALPFIPADVGGLALVGITCVAGKRALLNPAITTSRSAPAKARSAETPSSIRCVVPVWGNAYVTTFLEAALPSHLAPGNLDAFGKIPTIYQLFTDQAGRAAIEQHPLFPTLQSVVSKVEFHDIERFRRASGSAVNRLSANYSIMNASHHAAIDAAAADQGALLFVNCDTVYSAGVFTRVMALHKKGYRSVENLSIRTDRDQMLAALAAHRDKKGVLSLGSDALTEIALQHLHWIAKCRFWNGSPSLTIPDNLYWRVGEKALLARATHFMPLYVFPRNRQIQYEGTIDHGLAAASGVRSDEMWRFEDADEPSSWELSLSGHDQAFLPYERGSIREFTRFVAQQCEAVHLQNLQRPVRIGEGSVSAADWQAAIDESAEIMAKVSGELQHLVLTPWRDVRRLRADAVGDPIYVNGREHLA